MLDVVCDVCNKVFRLESRNYYKNMRLHRINVCSLRCAKFARLGKMPKRCKICTVVIPSKFDYCKVCKAKTSLVIAAKPSGN